MKPIRFAALLLLGTALPGWAAAEAATPSGLLVRGTAAERLDAFPALYRDAKNPLLQEVAFTGQLQTQYAYGSNGDRHFGTMDDPSELTWGNIEVRRMRLGLKAKLLGNISFLNLTELNPDISPRLYRRTPENYFTYTRSPAFALSVGKSELKFDREQEYSSREFLPFERSAVGNMFYGGELTGLWTSGSGLRGGWLYHLGIYSNERRDEWTHFDGGTIILAKTGYNYTRATSFDLAEVKFQYLHNTEPGYAPSPQDLAAPRYSDCFSLSNQLAEGRFGLTQELLWGDGTLGRPNAWALNQMATWSFSEKLQLVTTFELAGSPQENGILLPGRYEGLSPGAGDKRGDSYLAAYAGLNYYISTHKLKLMAGTKYSYLDGGSGGGDFNGWTIFTGLRAAF